MKLKKRIVAMGAAMVMTISMMSTGASAATYFNYNLKYNRYATSNNVTTQTINIGTTSKDGQVILINDCSKLQYASKVTTYAEVYCTAPQGTTYYSLASVTNTDVGSQSDIGYFTYIEKGNKTRNVLQLSYSASSNYTQIAEGKTTSY